MKVLLLLIISFLLSKEIMAQTPGSGNTIDFDGADDVVEIVDNQSFASANSEFTIECWIKTTEGSGSNNVFVTNYGGTGQNPFFMLGIDNVNAFFWCRNDPQTISRKPTTPKANVVDGNWHHLAGVRSTTSTDLYLDGILVGSQGAITSDVRLGTIVSVMDHYNRYTIGQIDEIRIWTEARSQTEIRDNMCKRLNGSELNLHSYYTLDGTTNVVLGVIDDSGNGFNGTMMNMTAGDIVTSAAPIGDESIHSYAVTTSTSLHIASSDGDDLTASVTSITSTPGSMHVYRVDEKPNVITPPGTQAQLSQNTYYGVKVFGGSGVIYTVNYNYNGHPGIIDENNLELAKRDNNADATWSQEMATLNTTANTLILTGQTGTEYILATLGTDPLPIELLNFYAEINYNNYVQLTWQTLTETNNEYFTIERSENGLNWVEVIDIESKNPNSLSLLSYSTIDNNPYNGISYYRLKQTDFDGQFSYSQIRSVNIKGLERLEAGVFPNPSEDHITLEGSPIELEHVKIYNHLGQDVTLHTLIMERSEQKLVIDLSRLSDGAYYIKTKTTAKKVYKR